MCVCLLALCVFALLWFSRDMPSSTPNHHQFRSQSNVIFTVQPFSAEKRMFRQQIIAWHSWNTRLGLQFTWKYFGNEFSEKKTEVSNTCNFEAHYNTASIWPCGCGARSEFIYPMYRSCSSRGHHYYYQPILRSNGKRSGLLHLCDRAHSFSPFSLPAVSTTATTSGKL